MRKNLISIIIPTFNEKGNIIRLISEIEAVANRNKLKIEVIVVDDNSTDKTGIIAKKKCAKKKNVKVFIRKKEKGLGTAILHGILRSKGNVIVSMDADFNHPPDLIPKLIEKLNKADLAVASRFIKGGGMEDKPRSIGTFFFNIFLHYFLGFPTMDNMSGYYAIKRKTLFSLPLKEIYRGYGEYHLRLLYLARAKNLKIAEVAVYYPRRVYGKSKSDLKRLVFTYLKEALKLSLVIKKNEIQNSPFKTKSDKRRL